MKITKSQIKQIIQEELDSVKQLQLSEDDYGGSEGARNAAQSTKNREIAIGEKALLYTTYVYVTKIQGTNSHLKNVIKWAAKQGRVTTFKGLVDFIRAST